jgi:rhomboid protease GluP
MFAQFSARLYENAAGNEYRLATSNDPDISNTTHWIMQKVEMATLVTVHVMDASRIDLQTIGEYDKKTRAGAEALLNQVGQVTNLYVLAGFGEMPPMETEEFFGQQIYSIFWFLNLATGEITAAQGQPKKLFNLREMIDASYKACGEASPENFQEITQRAVVSRPRAKHRYPLFSYMLIFTNAAILGLMYLDGYQADSVRVPIQFGAIVADMVVYGGEWYRLFASMFLHFGVAHFFSNAFGILIFGARVEKYFGRLMFVVIYIFSGLMGSVFTLVHSYFFQPFAVSAGASGAVYGIVGAIFAYTRITKRSIDFINWYLMLIYIGLGMAMGFATPGIGNAAHVGGLLCGLAIGGLYAKRVKRAKHGT